MAKCNRNKRQRKTRRKAAGRKKYLVEEDLATGESNIEKKVSVSEDLPLEEALPRTRIRHRPSSIAGSEERSLELRSGKSAGHLIWQISDLSRRKRVAEQQRKKGMAMDG